MDKKNTLEAKIKYLLKLIPEEENNLFLWQFYEKTLDIQNAIQDLKQEKDSLELQGTEVYIKADSKQGKRQSRVARH